MENLNDKETIKQCINKLKEKGIIDKVQYTKLCNIVSGVSDATIVLNDLLSIYFNDNALLEEIYKSINSTKLCFLHRIDLFSENLDISVIQHTGTKMETTTLFDPDKYYNEQINKCENDIFAIPIVFGFKIGNHANILIVKRLRYYDSDLVKSITVEHFEPHGKMFYGDEIESENQKITDNINQLVHQLFDRETHSIYIITPDILCPESLSFGGLQGLVRDSSEWNGTCAIFTMWYAFKRLTEPYKSYNIIYQEMIDVFLKNDPIKTIEAITHSFVNLLNINLNTSEINDDKTISANNRNIITMIQSLRNNTYESDIVNIPHKINNTHLIKILKLLKNSPNIKILNIINNNFNYSVIKELVELLTNNTSLLEINLSHNMITDVFMIILADVFIKNTTLQTIDLSNNIFEYVGVMKIADIFKYNNSLLVINLSNNAIGDEGMSKIAEGLKTNESIKKIFIGRCMIGDIGASYLADGLKINRSLKQIFLANNLITQFGAMKLFESLKSNPTVVIFLLANKISQDEIINLSHMKSYMSLYYRIIFDKIEDIIKNKYIKYKIKYNALRDTLHSNKSN